MIECKECGWSGAESELDSGADVPVCPCCALSEYLGVKDEDYPVPVPTTKCGRLR